MTEPTTAAGRELLREHSSGTPHMARHILAIEAEAVARFRAEAIAAVEAQKHSGSVWTGAPLLNRDDTLAILEDLKND